jgi:murein DD-endopeptidase MepM/ murein hydrolase activator NlpD
MEKIFAQTDKILVGIGRRILARPLLATILLLATIISTITYQEFLKTPAPLALETTPLATLAPPLARPSDPAVFLTSTAIPSTLSAPPLPVDTEDKKNTLAWQRITVRSGDTLSRLFKRHGLSAKETAQLARLANAKALHHLKQGQELRLYKDPAGQLQQLVYAISDKSTLHIVRVGNSYAATTQAVPITTIALAQPTVTLPTTAIPTPTTETDKTPIVGAAAIPAPTSPFIHISGRITHSLAADARKAGLSKQHIHQLAAIFDAYHITQKLRAGDEFSVLHENPASTAKKGTPVILAAQLIVGGKVHRLIRFADAKGHVEYYTPEGRSTHDALSRQPLHYTHISSYFSERRWHPILHYNRPHEGVDFTAPYGTPIQAAGDGTFIEVGFSGGYGRMITLQHDNGYTTRYAHLSRFATSAHLGQPVKKGQIIGYVGQTGFATGSHLHYEIRIHDVPANPLTVALPKTSVPAASRGKFFAQTRIWLAQLDSKRQIWLAQTKSAQMQQKHKG